MLTHLAELSLSPTLLLTVVVLVVKISRLSLANFQVHAVSQFFGVKQAIVSHDDCHCQHDSLWAYLALAFVI